MNDPCCSIVYRSAVDRVADELGRMCDLSELRDKTVLVTGATGQLGRALVKVLAHLNEKNKLNVTILAGCRSFARFRVCYEDDAASRIAYVPFDSSKSFDCDRRVDYVIHCAGYGDPRAFIDDPVGVMEANIKGVGTILSYLAKQEEGRLLFVSSGEVYGRSNGMKSGFDEEFSGYVNTMLPRSCYQTSKRAGEALVAAYVHQYGVDALVARQCHVFGPGFSDRDSRVTAQFLRAAKNNQSIVMKSAGSQVRSYIFELDAVAAYVYLLLKGESGEAYNVSPDYTATIKELAIEIARFSKVGFYQDEKAFDENRSGYSKNEHSVLNNDKIASIGWSEIFSFEEGVEITCDALR